MKLKPTFTLVFLVSFLTLLSIITPTHAADNKRDIKEGTKPRWFEIEVILFNQLSNKKQLKENFPEIAKVPKPSKFFDLLTTYLHPNISELKTHLLSCDASIQEQNDFNSSSIKVTNKALFIIKSLDAILQITKQEVENKIETEHLNSGEYLNSTSDDLDSQIKNNIEKHYSNLNNKNDSRLSVKESRISYQQPSAFQEPLSGLTDEEVALLDAADTYFSTKESTNYTRYPSFKVNQKISRSTCVIPKTHFQNILTQKELLRFDINSFPIKKTPLVINAPQLPDFNNPYLINKDSLQLKSIITQLRWSKEFQPLMHLGWRQIGVTRKKAIPLKLYAGDNLDYAYQQAMLQKEVNQKLNHSINVQDEADTLMKNLSSNSANQQHINYILNNISSINDNDINTILSDLDSVIIDQSLVGKNNVLTNSLNNQTKIEPPIQPWNIDGFFKVHLDHYLYITADLSIVNTSLLETEDQPKTIGFNQNRRVISGEIHYFDHPYIGMIVQIRRFDPDKPADEAVTQAIK